MGKTVIVTGAGRGTGRLVASQFAARGWNVAAADLFGDRVRNLAQEIDPTGAQIRAVQVDVNSDRAVEAMVKCVVDGWKTVDVLVSMAGGYGPSFRNSHETPEDEWDMVVGSNMKGVFLCAKHVIPFMRRAGAGGSSILLPMLEEALALSWLLLYGSEDGRDRHHASSRQGICRPRHRREYRRAGPLDGDRVADQLRDPQDRQALVASIPVGRLGREAEIAAVVMFLANEAPTYMTGAILDVNGGLVLAA